ncbi:MAG: hypothetical protein QG553_53 [Patescibacteria group bacterium]|nr:hypothetical protein [Patescibacteria group bacterium]
MNPVVLTATVIFFIFAFVILFGAPYLPTMKKQSEEALDMLALKPGQTMLELGCGDGRVAKAAARRGLKVVGYELNPILALIAWLQTLKYRGQVKIVWGNYWRQDWPDCDGIFVFLLDKYMKKLDKKIVQKKQQQAKPIRLLSYTFLVPGRKTSAQKGALFLYKY